MAYANIDPKPDPKEVDAWKWVEWSEFLRIKDDPNENFLRGVVKKREL